MMQDFCTTAAATQAVRFDGAMAHQVLTPFIWHDRLPAGKDHRQIGRTVIVTRALQRSRKVVRPKPCLREDKSPDSYYLTEVAKRPRLSIGEEYGLAVRMKAGDMRARDSLIEANLGLVVMFARRYQKPGVPLLDLIAEGNIGLLAAAPRFDPELGYRFATYAKWWVMRAILMALPKLTGVVCLPAGQRSLDARPQDSTAQEDSYDEPEHCACGQETHTEPRANSAKLPLGRACNVPSTTDEEVLSTIASAPEHEPPEALMAQQRCATLTRVLEGLPERERIVINKRFALTTDKVWTLEHLANQFGVSLERVRQIEKAALSKLHVAFCNLGLTADALL